MKRWRYRKITPEQKQVMREMREQGAVFREIAEKFEVSISTAQYHCIDDYRERTIARVKNSPNYHKKGATHSKEEMREYMRERFNSDKEFKNRVKTCIHKTQKKRREKAKRLAQSNPEVREKLRAYYRGELSYADVKEFYCLTKTRNSK